MYYGILEINKKKKFPQLNYSLLTNTENKDFILHSNFLCFLGFHVQRFYFIPSIESENTSNYPH